MGTAAVYPRVGGATDGVGNGLVEQDGLPPRGRGNLLQRGIEAARSESTPAWAGQPPMQGSC